MLVISFYNSEPIFPPPHLRLLLGGWGEEKWDIVLRAFYLKGGSGGHMIVCLCWQEFRERLNIIVLIHPRKPQYPSLSKEEKVLMWSKAAHLTEAMGVAWDVDDIWAAGSSVALIVTWRETDNQVSSFCLSFVVPPTSSYPWLASLVSLGCWAGMYGILTSDFHRDSDSGREAIRWSLGETFDGEGKERESKTQDHLGRSKWVVWWVLQYSVQRGTSCLTSAPLVDCPLALCVG